MHTCYVPLTDYLDTLLPRLFHPLPLRNAAFCGLLRTFCAYAFIPPTPRILLPGYGLPFYRCHCYRSPYTLCRSRHRLYLPVDYGSQLGRSRVGYHVRHRLPRSTAFLTRFYRILLPHATHYSCGYRFPVLVDLVLPGLIPGLHHSHTVACHHPRITDSLPTHS